MPLELTAEPFQSFENFKAGFCRQSGRFMGQKALKPVVGHSAEEPEPFPSGSSKGTRHNL
jgi:hypothetical protein